MTDALQQWREYLTAGRAFSVQADRPRIAGKQRANRVALAVSLALLALVTTGLVALVAAGDMPVTTYLLVGLFALSLLVVVLRLRRLGRRLSAYAAAADPLVVVSAESITLSGLPPIAWGDVLGVIATDLVDEYAAARGFGGWLRRTAISTGGATVGVAIGIERAGAYRAGATGGLVSDLIVVTEANGQVGLYLDHALPLEEARQVVTALKVAAWLNGVGFLASSQASDGAAAAAVMLRGERLDPRP